MCIALYLLPAWYGAVSGSKSCHIFTPTGFTILAFKTLKKLQTVALSPELYCNRLLYSDHDQYHIAAVDEIFNAKWRLPFF